jgi:NAD(P)-dependent dehydrogenase (short-subunit alcohol dehydrogenase family)
MTRGSYCVTRAARSAESRTPASTDAWYEFAMAGKHWAGLVVWITGAGSGIGKALAIELAAQGAILAVSGRRKSQLDEVVGVIEGAGGRALAVPCDVTREEDLEAAVTTITSSLGRLDAAIANAGFSVAGPIRRLSAADWRRQLDTNVVGAALTAKHAIPALEKTRGRLALIGSVAAFTPAPRIGAYNASKAALRMIGQTLDIELAGSGVSVSIIHPGFVESDIARVDNEGRFDASRPDKRPKALMWPADRAAKVIARAVFARKHEHVFTVHGKVGAFIGQHAPGLIRLALTVGGGNQRMTKMTKGDP